MSFEESNFDDTPEDGQLPEESNNNRTFLIAAGILGGIILLAFACIVGVYLYTQNTTAQVEDQNAALTQTAVVNSNFINEALTATQQAALIPTATLQPTNTLVVQVPTTTNTPDPNAVSQAGTPAAATATVGAALTQAAIAQLTIVPTTTGLPNTGFVDDVGVPGLVVMALAFMIVILISRRLRFAPSR